MCAEKSECKVFLEFREQVWGEKGKESSEYYMLIDWVTKHQAEDHQYTKQAVIEAYEGLLTDLYRAQVRRRFSAVFEFLFLLFCPVVHTQAGAFTIKVQMRRKNC